MELHKLLPENVLGKAVLVRIDAEIEGEVDSPRMKGIEAMAKWLVDNGAGRIKMIGHNGKGAVGVRLSSWWGDRIEINEDLRQDAREEQDSDIFAQELAQGFDVYINDAFSVCHREHASVVALPKYMKQLGKPVYAGLRLTREIEMLTRVFSTSPLSPSPKLGEGDGGRGIFGDIKLLIVGGAKAEDKAKLVMELAEKFDKLLIGGTLGTLIVPTNNMIVGRLREDGLDIDDDSIGMFVNEIKDAKVVVVAGPMGKFEQVDAQEGTRQVFTAAANSGAYKVAGGGNTEVALEKFGLTQKFDWISVGGGAMLQFLAKGTLPGIEVLVF